MKARPILFSAPMVLALLAGRKVQTRRAVKPQPPPECGIHYMLGNESWMPKDKRSPLRHTWEAWGGPLYASRPESHMCGSHDVVCPYGMPGDLLYVREAFMHEPATYVWEASVSTPAVPAQTIYRADVEGDTRGAGWRPGIHMPRALSRLTLRLTDVRVERLQDISDADAIAEGIVDARRSDTLYGDEPLSEQLPHLKYRELWESINGKGSWSANPFVWALTFSVIQQNVDDVMREAA